MKIIAIFLVIMLTLIGCTPQQTDIKTVQRFPEFLYSEIPENYNQSLNHSGQIEEYKYQTKDNNNQVIYKYANVYVPYGYDSSQEYNILYLNHGGKSDETAMLGTNEEPSELKTILDHMIEDQSIEPLIVVAPGIHRIGNDYMSALNSFQDELVNDLIPSIESHYKTYATKTTQEGLKASRNHRAIGGFSMGAYVTWQSLINHLDYFEYYLPLSWYYSKDNMLDFNYDVDKNIEYMEKQIKQTHNNFYIFAATGSEDMAYKNMTLQMNALKKKTNIFKYTDLSFNDGNMTYFVKDGYNHNYHLAFLYIYNGLKYFFH